MKKFFILSHRQLEAKKERNKEVLRVEVKGDEILNTIGTLFQKIVADGMGRAGKLKEGHYSAHFENENRNRIGVQMEQRTFGGYVVGSMRENGQWINRTNKLI